MSAVEVDRRLHAEDADQTWPKHCGQIMMLRHPNDATGYTEQCYSAACQYATYGHCSCLCGGKYHGVRSAHIEFSEVKVAPLPWYRRPITKHLEKSEVL